MKKLIGNKFEEEHYTYLERLVKWYAKDSVKNSIKIKWSSGIMQQHIYADHEKQMLNKMVTQYNERGRKDD